MINGGWLEGHYRRQKRYEDSWDKTQFSRI